MLIGPAVSLWRFYKTDIAAMWRGDVDVLQAYLLHMIALLLWLWWLHEYSTLPWWVNIIAAYAALSLLRVRTFLEHQAHADVQGRTVVVEDRGFFAFLFLNNNFHLVHHTHPKAPWYVLPDLYSARRNDFLERNSYYRYANYGCVFTRYLFKRKDPVPHPILPMISSELHTIEPSGPTARSPAKFVSLFEHTPEVIDVQTKPVIAALPMYDYAPMRAAAQRFWSDVRLSISREIPEYSEVPEALGQPTDVWAHWRQPDLFFSQTCGYPYISGLRDTVHLIGTPDYGVVPGLPGWYCSVIVVHANDMRRKLADFQGASFVCNGRDSQSGCHAMMFEILTKLGERRLFDQCVLSGSHIASVAMVADGNADIAAIDAVTWQLLQRYQPAAANLRVLGRTVATPGLPYITARQHDVGIMTNAVVAGIDRLSKLDSATLGIKGFWHSSPEDYNLIAEHAEQSEGVLAMHDFRVVEQTG